MLPVHSELILDNIAHFIISKKWCFRFGSAELAGCQPGEPLLHLHLQQQPVQPHQGVEPIPTSSPVVPANNCVGKKTPTNKAPRTSLIRKRSRNHIHFFPLYFYILSCRRTEWNESIQETSIANCSACK